MEELITTRSKAPFVEETLIGSGHTWTWRWDRQSQTLSIKFSPTLWSKEESQKKYGTEEAPFSIQDYSLKLFNKVLTQIIYNGDVEDFS